MLNYGSVRNERIARMQRKLERLSEKLKTAYSVLDLSQFERLEKEIEIQKSYKMIEHIIPWHDELVEKATQKLFNNKEN